jgi:glycosyltransferase involved in cell wall biosynthesis
MDGPPTHRVSIVLPAYNEEANVGSAVRRAEEIAGRLCADHEVIVVDDGSVDATAAVVRELAARDPRVRLVQHPANRGYGGALRSGFLAARMDLVFLTDADNQFDLGELGDFLSLIDECDVVAGFRMKRRDPLLRRLNGRAWNVLVRALFDVPLRDVDCAFKLFRREVFDDVELSSVGAMVSTELIVKISRSGYRIVEVGVGHYPRTAGSPHGANLGVIARAFVELARMRRPLATMPLSAPRARSLH